MDNARQVIQRMLNTRFLSQQHPMTWRAPTISPYMTGAYNAQRPELSGTYNDFVVYPGMRYVVVVAPQDRAAYTVQVGTRTQRPPRHSPTSETISFESICHRMTRPSIVCLALCPGRGRRRGCHGSHHH